MISHGCTKAEAAAAEQLIKSLIAQSEDTDAPFCPLPSAAQKGRATVASTSASSRDANAALAASAAESETTLPAAAAKESGGVSARAVAVAATAKVVNAAGVTSSPRDAKEIVDYSMFEQVWMADLTAAIPKVV